MHLFLSLGGGQVVEELLGSDRVGGLGALVEHLDANEGLSSLRTGRGDRQDGDIHACLTEGSNIPGAGHRVGSLTIKESLLGDVAGDGRGDDARVALSLQPVREVGATGAAHGQLGGVFAISVGVEDGGSEGGLEAVEVVRIALVAHLDDEGVLNTGGLTRRDHVIVGLGLVLGESVIAHQGNRLDGVGDTVGLAVVGDGLDGDVCEVGLGLAEVHGGDDAVSDECAELVVGHNDQVGAVAGGNLGGEFGIHVGFGLLNDVDLHAGAGGEVLSEGFDLGEAGIVRPNRQGRHSAGRGAVRGGRGRGRAVAAGGQGGSRREDAECCDATSHYYSCVDQVVATISDRLQDSL